VQSIHIGDGNRIGIGANHVQALLIGRQCKALGVMPAGWRGVIATLIASTCRSSLLSVMPTTYTRLVLLAVTNNARHRGIQSLHPVSLARAPHHVGGMRPHTNRIQAQAVDRFMLMKPFHQPN